MRFYKKKLLLILTTFHTKNLLYISVSLFRVNIRTFKPIPRLTRFTWFHKDWEKSWRTLDTSLILDLVMKKQWILIKGALFGEFRLFYFLTWADKRHKLSWDDEIPRNLPALQSCLINTHLTSKTPQKTPRKDKNTLRAFLVTKHDRRINSSPKKNNLTPRKKSPSPTHWVFRDKMADHANLVTW